MKTMRKIHNLLFALTSAALFTSCASELENTMPTQPDSAENQILISAQLSDNATRLAYAQDGMGWNLNWTADDKFTVFKADGSQTVFNLVEGANSVAAKFMGTASYQNGDKLYAVYNKHDQALNIDRDGNVILDIEGQTGMLDDRFQYMFGETSYRDGENTSFVFKHLTSIIKANFHVPTGTVLKNVTLECGNIKTKTTLVLNNLPSDAANVNQWNPIKTGDLAYSYNKGNLGEYGEVSEKIQVSGSFAEENGIATVYFYVLPTKGYDPSWDGTDFFWLYPKFIAETADGQFLTHNMEFEGKDLQGGVQYELDVELDKTMETSIYCYGMSHYSMWGDPNCGTYPWDVAIYDFDVWMGNDKQTCSLGNTYSLSGHGDYYAFASLSEVTKESEGVFKWTLTGSQTNPQLFGFHLVPVNGEINFTLKPINAVVQFWIPDYSIWDSDGNELTATTGYIIGNNGESLAGDMRISWDGDSPVVENLGCEKEVRNASIESDMVTLSLIPQTLSKGFTIGVQYSDGTVKTYSTSDAVALQSGQIRQISSEELRYWNAKTFAGANGIPNAVPGGKLD